MAEAFTTMPSVERILSHLDSEVLEMAEERLLPDLPQSRVDSALYLATAEAAGELLGDALGAVLERLRGELHSGDPASRANAIVELVILGATQRSQDIENLLGDHAATDYGGPRPSEPCADESRRQLGTFMAVVKGSGQKSLPGEPLGRGRFRAKVSAVASWGLQRLALVPAPATPPG